MKIYVAVILDYTGDDSSGRNTVLGAYSVKEKAEAKLYRDAEQYQETKVVECDLDDEAETGAAG